MQRSFVPRQRIVGRPIFSSAADAEARDPEAPAEAAPVASGKATSKATLSLSEVFDVLDTDGDGKLSVDEVVAGCGKLGMTPQEATEFVAKYDKDKSGTLERAEFATGLVPRLLGSKWVVLGTYLGLWYAFNAGFNVSNKLLLNKFPHPWVVSWCQLATGLLFVLPAWGTGLRSRPKVDKKLLLSFLPIALLHSSGHASQVASMAFGSVFFTHVIKASEPVIGTLVVLFATGKIAPWYVNLCLTPIVGGVAYAATKPGMGMDLSLLWAVPSLLALGSTVAFAVAKLLAKNLMSPELKKEKNLYAANNYAVLTCCSSAVLFFPSMLAEGPAALASFAAMGPERLAFAKELLVCGGFYYAYNEMGFRVLDLLGPVSQAVANSAKRVVILFAAVLFLGETVTSRKLIGSSVAIGGVTLYSLAKAAASKKKGAPKKLVEVTIVEDRQQAGSWQP